MECPNCRENYSFTEVPIQDRNMKFLVTEFICPYCEIWLKPDKNYSLLVAGFIVLMFLSSVLFIIAVEVNGKALLPAVALLLLSIALIIIGKFTLKLEIKKI